MFLYRTELVYQPVVHKLESLLAYDVKDNVFI